MSDTIGNDPRFTHAAEPDEHDPVAVGERVTAAYAEALNEINALRAEVEKWRAEFEVARSDARDAGDIQRQEKARADKAFVRGASWAYAELTGALIVPASFEEKAREAPAGEKEVPRGR